MVDDTRSDDTPAETWSLRLGTAALLLGLGAAAAPGTARAGVPPAGDAVLIRLHAGEVQMSEAGGPFQALPGADTAAGGRLKSLLEQRARTGATEVLRIDPMVVADGAGGIQWVRPPHDAAQPPPGQAEPDAVHAPASAKPVAAKHPEPDADKKAK
jgi:hypothetical protein